MIVDARALDVEAVPSEILKRNAELNALSTALDPLLDGYRGEHSMVFGPSGSGKTACARYTVNHLRREIVDVRTQYINCWQHSSRFAALLQLVDGIGQSMDIQQHSTPHDELLRRLRQSDDRPYVVVLDEADQLDAREDILYELTRLEHVHMILIANSEEALLDGLDRRVISRLRGSRTIQFDSYGTNTLVDILSRRAKVGLEPAAVSHGVLEEIAEMAGGDARMAIRTLAEAAKRADQDGTAIKAEYIEDATVDAQDSILQELISKFNRHQRIIFDMMRETDRKYWSIGELHDAYRDRVDDSKSKKTIKRYLKKMAHYDAVGIEGKTKGRRYWLKV